MTGFTTNLQVLPIDSIQPYWRNPRSIPEEAIEAVTDSIKRYGYQQPIIVDTKNTIIAGHTRYAALRRLKVAEVPVIVAKLTAKKAKEYRVLDNRVAEMSTWDEAQLIMELREFENGLVDGYFPNIDLQIGEVDSASQVTEEDVKEAEEAVTNLGQSLPQGMNSVVCPSCYHEFDVST